MFFFCAEILVLVVVFKEMLCFMVKEIHFGPIFSKDIVPEMSRCVQVQLRKLQPRCHFHFRQMILSPDILYKQVFFE